MTIHVHSLLIAIFPFLPLQDNSVRMLNASLFCKQLLEFPELYYDESSSKTSLLQETFPYCFCHLESSKPLENII